jgi:hypothetical protein
MERWGKQVSTSGWTNRTKLGLGSLGVGTLAIGAGIGAYLYTQGTEKSATTENDGPATNSHLEDDECIKANEYRLIRTGQCGATTEPLDENQETMVCELLKDTAKTETTKDKNTLRRLAEADGGGFAWNTHAQIRKPVAGRIILAIARNIMVVDKPTEEWGTAETTTVTHSTRGTTTSEPRHEAAIITHVAMMEQLEKAFPAVRVPTTDRTNMTATALSSETGKWLDSPATCLPTDKGLACASGNVHQLLAWRKHSMSRPGQTLFGGNFARCHPMYTE